MNTQRRLGHALERERQAGVASGRLRRCYELTTLLALTADESWPVLTGWEREVRSALPENYRDWVERPSSDPAQAAVVVLEAWRGVESPVRGERLVAEGWDRLRRHPSTSVRDRQDRYRLALPDPPAPPARLPPHGRGSRSGRDIAREVFAEIAVLRADHALSLRHVSAWATAGEDRFAPDEISWDERRHLAIVLHMICAQTACGTLGGPLRAQWALGITKLPAHPVARFLREGRGLAPECARVLVDTARELVACGLVDYQARRAVLAGHLRHDGLLLGELTRVPGLPIDTRQASAIIAAWAWIDMTRGMPASGPRVIRAAVEMHRRLDPEVLLTLRETTFRHLRAAEFLASDAQDLTSLADAQDRPGEGKSA